uniref:HMA domain-containing protein n=1 Tax=Candidatus Kentrum sp. TUN TaxID=2126343 RepID=A0A450ZQ68_9GAMM|nr:MAG: hypothetical protein BECKTUN1418D_GA0071000_103817 [Candidatus Kentron sp. TUN]
MDILQAYFHELRMTMIALAPSLLLGLLIAGMVHVFLPPGLIRRQLSASNATSAIRAALIGVPMPLCSCGVVPTAMGLRKEGASPGAAASFLISTPQTGVDSILVSAAFLGWPFALFKVVAAFVTGVFGGMLVNRFDNTPKAETGEQYPDPEKGTAKHGEKGHKKGRSIAIVEYALFDLLAVIDVWIVFGVLIAAFIAILAPPDFLATFPWATGPGGMLLVLAISLPLYVCTTGSIPIAAALIAAGMPTGTALVFLMAGPATNVVTVGAVYRILGARVLLIYLVTVIVMSIGFGFGFDFLLGNTSPDQYMEHRYGFLDIGLTWILIGLLTFTIGRRLVLRITKNTSVLQAELTLQVSGMSCNHCVKSVQDALKSENGVDEATAELSSGLVHIQGKIVDARHLTAVVERLGYSVTEVAPRPSTHD